MMSSSKFQGGLFSWLTVASLFIAITFSSGCAFLKTSAHNNELPPSRQLETAATLLDMLQTYRAIPADRQAVFLQAVSEDYEQQSSADNILRLALLLSVPDTPNSDMERADRLLKHLLSIPWALRADALNLARLRYQQVQHLLACQKQQAEQQNSLQKTNKKIANLQQKIKSLQKKINALTNIEQTVNSPADNKAPTSQELQ